MPRYLYTPASKDSNTLQSWDNVTNVCDRSAILSQNGPKRR